MKTMRTVSAVHYERMDDGELLRWARSGDPAVFRAITQRYNRRLYRVARGILGHDADTEDVVQETYVRAFEKLASFRGDSSLATWLTRIAINEALGRKRKRRPTTDLTDIDMLDEQGQVRVLIFPGTRVDSNPESATSRAEIRRLLERAIDDLPEAFRIVFVMREIEQMNVEETASQLHLLPETVKTRLHRARRILREALQDKLGSVLQDTYCFDGERCERMTSAVLNRIGVQSESA